MKSVMNHNFSQIPSVSIPRSVFNRSHGHKTTFFVGDLVPIYIDEALPGDTFHLSSSLLCRMATPIAPIMDNLFMETFFSRCHIVCCGTIGLIFRARQQIRIMTAVIRRRHIQYHRLYTMPVIRVLDIR